MANTTKPKPRLAILLQPHQFRNNIPDRSDQVHFPVCYLSPQDGKPRNCSRTGNYNIGPGSEMFENLVFTARISWGGHWGEGWKVNFFDCRYQGYMILDSNDLEIMTKGMRRVEKAAKNLPVRPETFGQYVCLMAAALGIKECVYETRNGHTGFYTDSEWTAAPISYAQQWIDEELARLRAKVLPEPRTEAA